MKRHAPQSFPPNSFVGRHRPLFNGDWWISPFVSRILKATDSHQIMVEGLCHAGKEASHKRARLREGVPSTSVRIAGLKVLCGFGEAIGCGWGKTTIESPEEDQFLFRYKTLN
jgi:hypothetical protein